MINITKPPKREENPFGGCYYLIGCNFFIQANTGKPSDEPCKAMVSFNGRDFPYVEKGSLFSDFLKRCVKERNVRLLYFFDEWDRKGTEENEIPVENIKGDILFLTSTYDESVPRNATQRCS